MYVVCICQAAQHMLSICKVYGCNIYPAATLRALRVSQARRDVSSSDQDCLRILSVFVTESPPTRGWGLPKFHNHELIS
jgi:hypothetical protein